MKLPRYVRKLIRLQEGALTAELDQMFPDKKLTVEYDMRPIEIKPERDNQDTGTRDK